MCVNFTFNIGTMFLVNKYWNMAKQYLRGSKQLAAWTKQERAVKNYLVYLSLVSGVIYLHWKHMRPCLIEFQKYYCMKTKLIALDWLWGTMLSWCQKICYLQSSSVMHSVEAWTHKSLEKLNTRLENRPQFDFFLEICFCI